MQNIHRELEYHAVQLCALAISNDSSAARVNAFGPISFCKSVDVNSVIYLLALVECFEAFF